ncbi:hypothetical protein FKM82_001200 [Ascaphus truei]
MLQKQHGRPATTSSCQRPFTGTGQRMLYTGPDYVGDYRTKLPDFTGYIGDVMPSPEITSEAKYLCRAAPGTPPPLHKESHVGGIGWGVSEFSFLNRNLLLSDNQIKRGDFHTACEDMVSHRYQNPWTPPPHVLDAQGCRARATLAWTPGTYDGYCYGKGYWATILDRSYKARQVPTYFKQGGFTHASTATPVRLENITRAVGSSSSLMSDIPKWNCEQTGADPAATEASF